MGLGSYEGVEGSPLYRPIMSATFILGSLLLCAWFISIRKTTIFEGKSKRIRLYVLIYTSLNAIVVFAIIITGRLGEYIPLISVPGGLALVKLFMIPLIGVLAFKGMMSKDHSFQM